MSKFEEYLQLYKERYGNSGPSISSSCEGKNNPEECGCWECALIDLRIWKDLENAECSVTYEDEEDEFLELKGKKC